MRGLRGSTERAAGHAPEVAGRRARRFAARGSIGKPGLAAAWRAPRPALSRAAKQTRHTADSPACGRPRVRRPHLHGPAAACPRRPSRSARSACVLTSGRGHGHPDGQRKPGQHQAGEERGVAQSLHGRDYPRARQNLGLRRSRSEARPSFTSGPAKPMNSSASEVSKAGPACRSQLFSEYLVQRIAVCEPSASLSATS